MNQMFAFHFRYFWSLSLTLAILFVVGCAYQPPTISHIHLGHAVTAAHETPKKAGYLVVAEKNAQDALMHANQALATENSLTVTKSEIELVNEITNTRDNFPLKFAVDEAVNHARFAAESDDSSENFRQSYAGLKAISEDIFYRCNLISLYSQDLSASDSAQDVQVLSEQIQQLTQANLSGVDLNEDGLIGNQPRESGVSQLRTEIEAMLAREDPEYETVDSWYLFNLIRLPSGEWVFKRSGSSGTRGY
jgi:hypothetical protein